MREKLKIYLESAGFQRIIVTVIILNSILIGLETDPTYMESVGGIIDQIDLIILVLFVIEILVKIYAFRLDFFKSPWNIFDSVVVLVSILPAAGSFAVFRALRILRTLRLLKNIPKLKIIIESLLHAVPSIGWIFVLLGIVYFVYAVIGTNLFGADYPEFFGSLPAAFFSLFQIMTLESWSTGIARPIIDNSPFAALYFVSFILLATYTTLNIFIAIVVNTMNELHHQEIVQEEEHIKAFVKEGNENLSNKIDILTEQIAKLQDQLDTNKKEKSSVLQD
ncbi:MAG: ion transporter [bacterium]|nr:ion transporter [bacterium]